AESEAVHLPLWVPSRMKEGTEVQVEQEAEQEMETQTQTQQQLQQETVQQISTAKIEAARAIYVWKESGLFTRAYFTQTEAKPPKDATVIPDFEKPKFFRFWHFEREWV